MLILLFISCTKPIPVATPKRLSTDEGLTADVISEGDITSRLAAPDEANLVLFYTGEQRADLQPCGCADTPRGGLPRTAAYIDAAGDGLILNGAGWIDEGQTLDGSPMADAKLKNKWMVTGLKQLGVDIVHVGFGDLIGLSRMDEPPDLPMISANLRGPGLKTHRVIDHGDQRIGISGIAHEGHISIATPGFERLDPYSAAKPILERLSMESDFVVLLNNNATQATKKLIREGLVDLVIETAHHRGFEPPFRHGNAVWVRSHDQGLRLGELRMTIDSGSGLTAYDRKIDLDSTVPSQTDMAAIANEAEQELKALDRALFSP